MANYDPKQILAEIEALCQTQILRIQNQLQLNDHQESMEVQTFTSPDADATPVLHAGGKRKPTMEEQEQRMASRLSRARRSRKLIL
jgi:hypothetical protein